MSKRQLLIIQTFVRDICLGTVNKGERYLFISTVTRPTESYTRPPSPLDRATASLRDGRCSPTCGGGGGVVAKG